MRAEATAGRFLIGLYLAETSTASAFGATGSLAVVLLWLYYSALVFLTGAEITKVYARRSGARIVPKPNAEWINCDPPPPRAPTGADRYQSAVGSRA
jgi:uncharacterized BrkB/YihY/UPF0761 family membrane protein